MSPDVMKMHRGARIRSPVGSGPGRATGPNTLTLSGPSKPVSSAPPRSSTALPPAAPGMGAPSSTNDAPAVRVSPLAESRALPWEKFWLVWSPSEARPQRRHGSLESAQREADRLHRMYGKEFLVFEARQIALDGPSSAAYVRP